LAAFFITTAVYPSMYFMKLWSRLIADSRRAA
jgi:hypothetical protein